MSTFLVFHIIAEGFATFVAVLIGIIAYYTFVFTKNRYLLFLGLGYIWIGLLDFLHTLTFPGMNLFDTNDVNVTLTIWTLTRVFEALILVAALLFRNKKFNPIIITILFTIISLSISCFAFNSPMILFIKDSGLTVLKNSLEYLSIAILVVAFILNKINYKFFHKRIYMGIQIAIVFTILAELSFTTYTIWNGSPAVIGHVLKFISFWVIFQSLIITAFIKPMNLMAKDTTTYNAMPMGSIVVTSEGIIKQVNKEACKSIGMSPEDVIEKSNHDLFHIKDSLQSECKICNAIKQYKEIEKFEIFDAISNKYYLFSTRIIGNIDSYSGTIQVRNDITNEKLLELEKNKQLIINEKLYKDLFELNKSVILLLNPKTGQIVNANQSAVDFYGYEKSKLLSLNISDINILSQEDCQKEMDNAVKKNHAYFNFIHKLANGEKRNVEVTSSITTYLDEQTISSTIRDTTSEHKSKQKLSETENEFKSLFEFSNIGLGIRDTDGNFIKINKKLLDMLGYDKEFLLNKTCVHISSKENLDEEIRLFRALINKEIPNYNIEKNYIRKDGTEFESILTMASIVHNGEISHILSSIIDISEMKKKDNLLFQQSKMAAMGEMIGNIAHQWKQPLSLISLSNGLIKINREMEGFSTEEEIDEAIGKIESSVEYLSTTIDDFRNFFKPNKETAVFDIGKVIEKTIKLTSAQFTAREITIIKDIESTQLESYENELIQVLMNILNNARDALENKKYDKFIFITTSKEDDKLMIKIKDNAGGIPIDIIEKIFEPYFTTKEESKGTGIGLYMSEEIITKHMKGTLTVQNSEYSYENKNYTGACFIIELKINS